MHEGNSIESLEEENRVVASVIREIRSVQNPIATRVVSLPQNTPSTAQRIKTPERKRGHAIQSPTSREIETEVDRINRFCESVDQNLASFNRSVRQRNRGVQTRSSLDAAVEIVPSMSRQLPEPQAIIDLSTYDSPLPQRRRLGVNTNDIIVLDDVVDLCSPSSNSIDRRPIGHTNLSGADESQLRRIELFRTTAQQQRVDNGSKENNKSSESQRNVSPERSPKLMCPVCMESTVNRQPTSTKCGHVFCATCISEAIRITHKCPICNTKLSKRMIFRIYV